MVTRILAEVFLLSILLGMAFLFFRAIMKKIDAEKKKPEVKEDKKESKSQGSE